MRGVRPPGSDPRCFTGVGLDRGIVCRPGTRSICCLLALLLAHVSASVVLAEPLQLTAGTPVMVVCETRAVVVATGAPAATSGTFKVRLESLEGTPVAKGTWTVVEIEQGHKGSFGATQKEPCATGCPLDVAAKGAIQLWAPAQKSLDKLGDGETLLIAVIKPEGAELRASFFRGKEIEALEEGTCKVAP